MSSDQGRATYCPRAGEARDVPCYKVPLGPRKPRRAVRTAPRPFVQWARPAPGCARTTRGVPPMRNVLSLLLGGAIAAGTPSPTPAPAGGPTDAEKLAA